MERNRSSAIRWALLVVAGSALGVLLLGLLATSITERRAERGFARLQVFKPVPAWEADNAKWGVNFPREYDSWEATKRMEENTRYGGSSARDHLADSPYRVVLWAGYAFAKGYNAPRGHFHSIADVTGTVRISAASPATCWSCKSPDVPRLMSDLGPARFYAESFDAFRKEVTNPIGCADCHDNETMALRISRPALIEALRRQGKDVEQATHQEMRSLVCAQCHVEYYFAKEPKDYLTFPWDRGYTVEDMQAYYEAKPHTDWVHAISGATMIKMQHPDFEIFSQGIHAYRGVACADCHMPYTAEGGIKYTDHQIRSPLYNTAASCQVCHRWSHDDVVERVNSIQDANRSLLAAAEVALSSAHVEIGDAIKRGAAAAELAEPRRLVSLSQMYWDYAAAANGMGFHAPQVSARVLATATDLAQQSRLHTTRVLARRGSLAPVVQPDLSTVAAAQAYIKPYVDAQTAALEAAKAERARKTEAESR